MRKLAVAALFGLTTLLVHAQSFEADKPIVCSDLKSVIELVSGPEFEEQPFWSGQGEAGTKYVLMLNPSTGTWTMVQYDNKTACVLGTGLDGKMLRFGKSV